MPSTPRILTIGAYERDNFGDLLFLLVTEKYLPDAEIVAAAPFAADMQELLDREVLSFTRELGEHQYDVIWTVGGQVGGTSPEAAYRMSHSAEAWASFKSASSAERQKILREAFHGTRVVSPYLPNTARFELNAHAVSVCNSVGLAGVRSRDLHARSEIVAALRSMDQISVRDVESSRYLDSLGIRHTLAPDVVHAISTVHPVTAPTDPDIAVVQVSTAILDELGHEAFALALHNSEQLRDLRLRFLLAGAAQGHDSFEDAERVIAHLNELNPTVDASVIYDRRPLELVDHIASARIVIGTSLHVRIIAAAYNRPRVTLRRAKPTKYAQYWDSLMPFDVTLANFDSAIGQALADADTPEVLAASARLTQLAHDNVQRIAETVLTQVFSTDEAERRRRTAERTSVLVDLDQARDSLHKALAQRNRSRARVARLTGQLEASSTVSGLPALFRRLVRRISGPTSPPNR